MSPQLFDTTAAIDYSVADVCTASMTPKERLQHMERLLIEMRKAVALYLAQETSSTQEVVAHESQ